MIVYNLLTLSLPILFHSVEKSSLKARSFPKVSNLSRKRKAGVSEQHLTVSFDTSLFNILQAKDGGVTPMIFSHLESKTRGDNFGLLKPSELIEWERA